MLHPGDTTSFMTRPQIRPAIFIGLQNGLAAAIASCLLLTELGRRLLYAYPESETLWWLSLLANRTVMPALQATEDLLGSPDRLVPALILAIAVPLLSWWTRYWFGTALSGHVAAGALTMTTLSVFARGTPDLPGMVPLPLLGIALALLTLFALVMCVADHVAFIRHIVYLVRWFRQRR